MTDRPDQGPEVQRLRPLGAPTDPLRPTGRADPEQTSGAARRRLGLWFAFGFLVALAATVVLFAVTQP